jgi:hypothetical protein
VTNQREATNYLDTLGKVAALSAVLLPAAGVITRYVAFSTDPPTHGAWELAYSAPLGQLVVNGSLSLVGLAGFVIPLPFWVRAIHAFYQQTRPRVRSVLLREAGFAIVILVAATAFFPGWPALLFFYPVIVGGVLMVDIAGHRPKPLTMQQLWPWVAGLMLVASVSYGLAGDVVGVGGRRFDFMSGASLAAGRYAPLATEGDMVFLQRCEGMLGQVVAVHQSAISMTTLDATSISFGPSLFQVVFTGKRPIGFGRETFC